MNVHAISIIAALSLIRCTSASFPDERQSFVKIRKTLSIKICKNKRKNKRKKKVCEEVAEMKSSGSGAAIGKNSVGSFILTAQHVCKDIVEDTRFVSFLEEVFLSGKKRKNKKLEFSEKMTAIDIEGQTYLLDTINGDEDRDICVMFAENMQLKPLRRRYTNLAAGEKIYNMAAPLGIFDRDLVPLFDGLYVGERDQYSAMYSLPATGGSSGSPILDENGRLVGMVHSVINGFRQIVISPRLEDMNEFLDDTLNDYYDKWYANILKMARPKRDTTD